MSKIDKLIEQYKQEKTVTLFYQFDSILESLIASNKIDDIIKRIDRMIAKPLPQSK